MSAQSTKKVLEVLQPSKSLNDDAKEPGEGSAKKGTPLEEMSLSKTEEVRTATLDLARDGLARSVEITIAQPSPAADLETPVGGAADAIPEQEKLDESLTACLEKLREDFNRGIVLIDDESTPEQYAAALEADKTAGQRWEALEARLQANGADLLKKAAAMPEGACLVGVYTNGELAIRQRSQEIMNARWTKEWQDGESDKGELLLLPHAEALACSEGRWAKGDEIIRAVKAAGYHVPVDLANYEKKGLVAASEAVTGGYYVMSPGKEKWRSAMLENPKNASNGAANRPVVLFNPELESTYVFCVNADGRVDFQGAVLWLRG